MGKGSSGALLVYDISRRESFDHVASWLEQARQNANANIAIMLVGNKCDLNQQRQVSQEEGASFARSHGLQFTEASASSGINVEDAFQGVARKIYENIQSGVYDLNDETLGIKLGGAAQPRGGGDAQKAA